LGLEVVGSKILSATTQEELVNAHAHELNHFNALAARWWDPEGPSKPLLAINPVRLDFVQSQISLGGKRVLDVGCGGGILTESLAQAGADACGIDLSTELLEVAKLHALGSGLAINYQLVSAEAYAQEFPEQFDAITCMEMLEHVPDPAAVIAACARLLKPGGVLVLSTLNRTPKAFALGIVAAEYLLNLVPRGTHRYVQFLKPAEVARELRKSGLTVCAQSGIGYSPFANRAQLTQDCSINYLMAARKA
jgi:2-polyprenyl-6-hydroxyphenyl methylase / 3-demethylubiquinone-9 3-methyltransferase